MAAEPDLRRSAAWSLGGTLAYAAGQWGLLIALAKLDGAEAVGRYALGLALAGPILQFTNLQLRALLATDARAEQEFADYLGLRWISTATGLLLLIVAVLATGRDAATASVLLAVGAAKAVESFSDLVHGLLQRAGRLDLAARSLMLRAAGGLAAAALALAAGASAATAILAQAAAWAAVLVGYDRANARRAEGRLVRPRWRRQALASLARMGAPLGIVMLLVSLNVNIPRYVVERTLGVRELGVFAALAHVGLAGTAVVVAIGEAASPRLARHAARGERAAFRRLLLRLLGLATLLGLAGLAVALALGRPLLAWLYSTEYAAHSDAFGWLMLAAAIGYVGSLLGFAATAARRLAAQPLVLAAAGAVVLGASGWLAPRMGLAGVAIGMCLAAATAAGGYALLLAGPRR